MFQKPKFQKHYLIQFFYVDVRISKTVILIIVIDFINISSFRKSIFIHKEKKKDYCLILSYLFRLPNQLGLYNSPTASLRKGKSPPSSIQDMTLNNLMVKLQ